MGNSAGSETKEQKRPTAKEQQNNRRNNNKKAVRFTNRPYNTRNNNLNKQILDRTNTKAKNDGLQKSKEDVKQNNNTKKVYIGVESYIIYRCRKLYHL
jgi:hypothetical protein